MQINETMYAILDVAQELLQTRGYNGFSIKDLADRVEIRTSSIHYYFPTKADLCRALISRHRQRVASVLAGIDEQVIDPRTKLERFASLFQSTIEAGNRMCPFGMLAAESETLETQTCEELRASFDDLENWLRRVLLEGRRRGSSPLPAVPSKRPVSSSQVSKGRCWWREPTLILGAFEVVARRLLEKLKK